MSRGQYSRGLSNRFGHRIKRAGAIVDDMLLKGVYYKDAIEHLLSLGFKEPEKIIREEIIHLVTDHLTFIDATQDFLKIEFNQTTGKQTWEHYIKEKHKNDKT